MIDFNSQENHAIKRNELLIEHIDRLHTTPMGVDQIKRNLKLDTDDAVGCCTDDEASYDKLRRLPHRRSQNAVLRQALPRT